MAKTIVPPEDVKEYGDQVQEAQDAEALAATAAMEQETTPQVAMPSPVPPEPQGSAAKTVEPGQTGGQPGGQPRSLMQLVPPNILFRDTSRRPQSVVRYDVGRLWEALADDPNVPSFTRALAARLKGEA